MERTLAKIYTFLHHRKLFFWSGLVLIFLILGVLASRIRFEEDIAKLLPKGEDTETLTKVLETIKFTDKTVLILNRLDEHVAPEVMQEYASELTAKLQENGSNFIRTIQGTADQSEFFDLLDLVEDQLPLFLDSTDYLQIQNQLHADSIPLIVKKHVENLVLQSGITAHPISFRQDPLSLILSGLKKFQALQGSTNLIMENGFILTKDKRNLFIFITPLLTSTETDHNEKFITFLQNEIDTLNIKFKEQSITGEFFGSTAMAVANAHQIKSDIQKTLSIALLVLVSLFIYFYRKVHIPLIILLPVIFGSLLGLVVLFWIKGTVSAVSIGIGSVLLGITLDYSLHILSHYRSTGDILHLYKSTTRALMICAVFTALDFLCLIFLRSEVLQDLGIFSAVSILGAAVFSLIFIPQVYKPGNELHARNTTWIDRVASIEYHHKKGLLFICLGLVILSLFHYKKVGFDNDLQNLNYQPEHLKKAVEKFENLTQTDGKSLYMVAYGSNLDEVLLTNQQVRDTLQRLQDQGKIKNFNSIAPVFPSLQEQKNRYKKWNEFWKNQNITEINQKFQQASLENGFKPDTYQAFFDFIDSFQSKQPLNFTAEHPLGSLIFSEWIGHQDSLYTILSTVKVDAEHVDEIRDIFKSDSAIIPIDRKQIQEEFLQNLEVDFDNLLWITSIMMFIVIFLFFGNLELTLITNIPVMLGWMVTLGLMGLFEVDFNAFNIIIATLVFGLGIDYAIFITKALMERYTFGQKDLSAYRTGILMSAMATLLCFGILVFAKHPAIRSIAIIPLIGLAIVVLMSFTVQPFLFEFYLQKPQNRGNTPRTLWNIGWTIYTFGYFFVGGFIFSVFSQLYMAVWPQSKKNKFSSFHKGMQKFFKILMYSSPNCKIHIRGDRPENFAKPVIVITNHTSQLDTPTIGMLHDKMIFVVNERVLKSKFFGRSLRMAGFYSTDEQNQAVLNGGQSPKILALKKKVEQGYSIIIFPEGTRSRTAEIGRFHKGAFLLAEQLGLDILPVLIHGNTDLLPKHDNILKPGDVTISYLPLIKIDDRSWGINYQERTKEISRYFKESFFKLRREIEGPNYFWTKLKFNFIYKPNTIQRIVKTIFKSRQQDYHTVFPYVSRTAKIIHLNSHYGILDFLLAYDSATRNILAWEQEVENRSICANTYSVNRYPVQFAQEESKFLLQAKEHQADTLILTRHKKNETFNLFSDSKFLDKIQTIILEKSFNTTDKQQFETLDILTEFVCVLEETFIKVYQRKDV